jgi:hypothetical protein
MERVGAIAEVRRLTPAAPSVARPLPAVVALVALVALVFAAGVAAGRPALAADCSRASAADFDGDGTDDVVVGDPSADVGSAYGAGAVHVLRGGGPGGLVLTNPKPGSGDGFGWTVRTGHVDADACLDVIVGVPYADVAGRPDAGAVIVFSGGPGGRVTTITAPAPQRAAHFGWSIAAGAGGLAVGAPFEDADRAADSGAVYFYQPGGDGDPGRARRITQDTPGIVGTSEPGDLYGWSLALGGLDGSKKGIDLAVGVPYENDDGDGRQQGGGMADTGALSLVYDLTLTGALRGEKTVMSDAAPDVGEHPGDRFGYALAYGQWGPAAGNGFVDGYLAVGAPGADAGAPGAGLVQIFQRRGAGRLTPLRAVRLGRDDLASAPAARDSWLGWSLAFWNLKGEPRLAIGSPFEQNGSKNQAGLVRHVAVSGGRPAGALPADPARAVAFQHYGWSVASTGGAGDFTPGPRLAAGIPDAGSGGAVVVTDGGTPRLFLPGRDGVPALKGGLPADFGSSVAG